MLFLLITLTSCKFVNNPHDMVMITGRVTYIVCALQIEIAIMALHLQ